MADHLYIHVPFCQSKCHYCAFYSVPEPTDDTLDAYVRAVRCEATARIGDRPHFQTVYFGGGTPSLLGAQRIIEVLEHLSSLGRLTDAEVTLEANPESVTEALLAEITGAGVNRISLGLQSLEDHALKWLGRPHTARQGRLALDAVQRHVERSSIDLIYGLPGQSLEDWKDELVQAASLGTEHISAYELTYEPGTVLGDRPHETGDRSELFFATHQTFKELGLAGYEVSNFACGTEARSRHNLATWAYHPYLGLGPGAHSFSGPGAGAYRRWNLGDVTRYIDGTAKGSVPHESEGLSRYQQSLERVMLGLRTVAGFSLDAVEESEGLSPAFSERLRDLETRGLVVVADGLVRPTLEGMGLADGLAAQWFD